MGKIRIISDLHYTKGINGPDYNGTSILWDNFGEQFKEKVDLNLIAGDICEGVENHKKFLETFFPDQKVFLIDGNHVCYEDTHPILSDLKKELKNKFPKEHCLWNYLENDWKWIEGTNTAVIGSTFYTDYTYCDLTLEELNEQKRIFDFWTSLYGLKADETPYEKLTKANIRIETTSMACTRLNDFKWGRENENKILSPKYYLQLHKLAKKEVKKCHDEIISINPNANIILMTHHCLSPKCISEKYKKGLINASYASDLENWVDKQLPRVKLVISGHVHNRCDFTFGKRNVRYITNPCGYIPYNEHNNEPKFNPNLIIDTEDLND